MAMRAPAEADANRIGQRYLTRQLLEGRRLENQRTYNDKWNDQRPGRGRTLGPPPAAVTETGAIGINNEAGSDARWFGATWAATFLQGGLFPLSSDRKGEAVVASRAIPG